MTKLFKAVAVCAAVAAFAVPAALADSCLNLSRQAPACNLSCTAPVISGNWVWLPSVDPSAPPAWGFAPPGAAESTANGLPGANGNYTNGQTSSLLGMSALCSTDKIAIFKRQDGVFQIVFSGGQPDFSLLRGVWSGCE
jgi:hypothetical protein